MTIFTTLPMVAAASLPEQNNILNMLVKSEAFFPVGLAIIGALLLIFGFTHHKWIAVINCIALGYLVGGILGEKAQITTVGGIIGAVVFGAISWPLMKYAVALSGGLVGAIVGMGVWVYLGQPESQRWAGALIGLAVLGMLSFVLFKASVILYSCIQGAAMLVLGSCALLIKYSPWENTLYSNFNSKPILMPVLVFAVALLGMIFQHQKHGLLDNAGAGGAKSSGGVSGGEAKKK